MPRHKNQPDEKRWWVIWPTHGHRLVGPPTFCDTQRAAQDAVEESRENDEYGWYAEYLIRRMTASEVAYELAA